MALTWVIEPDAFEHHDALLVAAAKAAGHRVMLWNDMMPVQGLGGQRVVFHGSLNVATRVTDMGWRPGAWCNAAGFMFTEYAEKLRPWLLNGSYHVSTVREQLSSAALPRRFMRPNSALKQFAGIVVEGAPSAMQLGFGFYHDDLDLSVIVAPVANVILEWRFIIVDRRVVSGGGYDANLRSMWEVGKGEAWGFASAIAATFDAPDPVYALDVAATPSGLRVVEVNPFSSADLYKCDCEPIVSAIERLLK